MSRGKLAGGRAGPFQNELQAFCLLTIRRRRKCEILCCDPERPAGADGLCSAAENEEVNALTNTLPASSENKKDAETSITRRR